MKILMTLLAGLILLSMLLAPAPTMAQEPVVTAIVNDMPADEPVLSVFAQQTPDINRTDLLNDSEVILTTTELILIVVTTAGSALTIGGGGALFFLRSLLNSKSFVDLFEKLYMSQPLELRQAISGALTEMEAIVDGVQRATDGKPNDDLIDSPAATGTLVVEDVTITLEDES